MIEEPRVCKVSAASHGSLDQHTVYVTVLFASIGVPSVYVVTALQDICRVSARAGVASADAKRRIPITATLFDFMSTPLELAQVPSDRGHEPRLEPIHSDRPDGNEILFTFLGER